LEKLLYGKPRRSAENGHLSAGADMQSAPAPVPIEFIAVPSGPERKDRRRKDESGPARAGGPGAGHVGGAGLEFDLAAGKNHPNLPEDVRSLSAPGLVNYPEAQAVVHKLEELARDPVLKQVSQTQRLSASCPVIAVVALYPAQAELIRRLIHKSAWLSQCQIPIEVGLPTAFRHRESLITLVSLTRSQGHRAVSYGESSESLPLALTRSRQRLILFGDPGQLARRSQWRGPLDHFDETAAALERRWVDQLLKYVPGQEK
jgi:hypothetical protein